MLKKIIIYSTFVGLAFFLINYLFHFFEQRQLKQFSNPLFYEKLSPVSDIELETYLTPKTYTYISVGGKKVVRKCTMIDNQQMQITLRCIFFNDLIGDMQTNDHMFVLSNCDEQKYDEYCYGGKWLVTHHILGSGTSTLVIKE